MFMAVYILLAIVALGGLSYGMVQYTLGQSPWSLLIAPAAVAAEDAAAPQVAYTGFEGTPCEADFKLNCAHAGGLYGIHGIAGTAGLSATAACIATILFVASTRLRGATPPS